MGPLSQPVTQGAGRRPFQSSSLQFEPPTFMSTHSPLQSHYALVAAAVVKSWHPSHRAAYSSELPLARRCGGHRLPGGSSPPALDSAPSPTGHRRSPRVFGRNGNAVLRDSTHSPVLEIRRFRVTLGIAVTRVSPESLNGSWKNMRVGGKPRCTHRECL